MQAHELQVHEVALIASSLHSMAPLAAAITLSIAEQDCHTTYIHSLLAYLHSLAWMGTWLVFEWLWMCSA